MHRPPARGGYSAGAAGQRMPFVIGVGRCSVVQCLWSDGRMPLPGNSRRRRSVEWVARSACRRRLLGRHALQCASKFTRKPAESGLGGEVFALSEMVGHVPLLRESRGPFEGLEFGDGGVGSLRKPLHLFEDEEDDGRKVLCHF